MCSRRTRRHSWVRWRRARVWDLDARAARMANATFASAMCVGLVRGRRDVALGVGPAWGRGAAPPRVPSGVRTGVASVVSPRRGTSALQGRGKKHQSSCQMRSRGHQHSQGRLQRGCRHGGRAVESEGVAQAASRQRQRHMAQGQPARRREVCRRGWPLAVPWRLQAVSHSQQNAHMYV